MTDETVTVLSKRYFRGEPGEGSGGMVSPGDELQVTRARAADLKVNGLVDTVADPAPDAPLAAQVTAAEENGADSEPLLEISPSKKAK